MVILVSAMLVASTILRRPGGGGAMAARWSLASRAPCRRNRSVSAGSRASRRSAVRSISATPGRKARMEPVSLTSAPRIALAMASSSRSAELRPTYRSSTGNIRPCDSTWTSPGMMVAKPATSSVADISNRRRSGRNAARASNVSASAKSESRLRSWTSSNKTPATPASSGSLTSMRVKMPSVTTSMRVAADVRASSRVR